jgi:hypothetical protein
VGGIVLGVILEAKENKQNLFSLPRPRLFFTALPGATVYLCKAIVQYL